MADTPVVSVQIEANDLIEVLTNQRNNALQEVANYAALIKGLQRENDALKAKLAEATKDAPSE